MKILTKVKLSEHKSKTPEGYLICQDAILARTGTQEYLKSEIYDDFDGEDELISVNRSEAEVFRPETLASFEDKPLTIEHPDEAVGPDNYSDLSVGHTRNVRRGEYEGQPVMIADIVVTNSRAIELIENCELTDLSCGYDCDITDGPNPEQINIMGNHVALCECGRAGIARIIDSKTTVNDFTTTRRQFKESDLDDEDSYLGTTEWATPKGSAYVYKNSKNGKYTFVSAEYKFKKFEFNSLKELNKWLVSGEELFNDSQISDADWDFMGKIRKIPYKQLTAALKNVVSKRVYKELELDGFKYAHIADWLDANQKERLLNALADLESSKEKEQVEDSLSLSDNAIYVIQFIDKPNQYLGKFNSAVSGTQYALRFLNKEEAIKKADSLQSDWEKFFKIVDLSQINDSSPKFYKLAVNSLTKLKSKLDKDDNKIDDDDKKDYNKQKQSLLKEINRQIDRYSSHIENE